MDGDHKNPQCPHTIGGRTHHNTKGTYVVEYVALIVVVSMLAFGIWHIATGG